MDNSRIKKLNNLPDKKGDCIIYIMSRDQRLKDNHALILAQKKALFFKIPLLICFNIYPKVKNRILQHYNFMTEGLEKLQQESMNLNITFIITIGKAKENFLLIEKLFNPKEIYFDFSPLNGPVKSKEEFTELVNVPIYLVDTHNIIPVWIASPKEEFSAYTLRSKIHKLLQEYIIEPDKLINMDKHINETLLQKNINKKLYINPTHVEWEEIKTQIKAMYIPGFSLVFKSSEKEANQILQDFLINKLETYKLNRNNPSIDAQTNLSPYFHYGQISSLRVILEVNKFLEHKDLNKDIQLKESVESLFEEIIVRKELADNFCYYNKDYDNFNGLKPWAKNSLIKHIQDKREHIYSKDELEYAKTYDDAWNAAQIQLISMGKIHGYMRMYWAKKLLEWTTTPKIAIEYATYLNDKYQLDGYDPNGYVGILWSLGGLHDRAWFEREIFGQIRYMNYNGLRRKFDLDKYIKEWTK